MTQPEDGTTLQYSIASSKSLYYVMEQSHCSSITDRRARRRASVGRREYICGHFCTLSPMEVCTYLKYKERERERERERLYFLNVYLFFINAQNQVIRIIIIIETTSGSQLELTLDNSSSLHATVSSLVIGQSGDRVPPVPWRIISHNCPPWCLADTEQCAPNDALGSPGRN